MINLKNVRKFYGALEVIKGVDITVEDGRIRRVRRPFRLRQVHAAAHDRRPRRRSMTAI